MRGNLFVRPLTLALPHRGEGERFGACYGLIPIAVSWGEGGGEVKTARGVERADLVEGQPCMAAAARPD